MVFHQPILKNMRTFVKLGGVHLPQSFLVWKFPPKNLKFHHPFEHVQKTVQTTSICKSESQQNEGQQYLTNKKHKSNGELSPVQWFLTITCVGDALAAFWGSGWSVDQEIIEKHKETGLPTTIWRCYVSVKEGKGFGTFMQVEKTSHRLKVLCTVRANAWWVQ